MSRSTNGQIAKNDNGISREEFNLLFKSIGIIADTLNQKSQFSCEFESSVVGLLRKLIERQEETIRLVVVAKDLKAASSDLELVIPGLLEKLH